MSQISQFQNFDQTIADEFCAYVASGMSMKEACSQAGMPGMSTVFKWLRANPDFVERYTRACEERTEVMIEEMIDIADDTSQDFIEITDEKGRVKTVVDHEHINRSRLRVDTRKWIASKLKPKKYGDATLLKHADPDGNVLKVQISQVTGTDE